MGSRWQDLLPEILVSIAGLLKSAEDFLALRRVCPAWRNAIKKDMFAGKSRVLLLVPGREDETVSVTDPYNRISVKVPLPEAMLKKLTVIGVGFGWLLIVKNSGKVRLGKYDSDELIYLPNFKSYPGYQSSFFIQRGVLSSNPSDDSSNFELAVIVNKKLGFWRPSYPIWDEAAETSVLSTRVYAQDICYYRGMLHVVDDKRNIVIWDPSRSLCHTKMAVDFARWNKARNLYLVVSSVGELLLIARIVQQRSDQVCVTAGFGGILLDLKRREWKQIHSLGSDAVFIGNNAAFTVPAYATLPDVIRPNCVYFTDDNFRSSSRGIDTGVYDVSDERFEWFHISNQGSTIFPPPLWLDTAADLHC